jgi:glycerate kinase
MAVIEAAQAIALADVPISDRDPSMLSSFPLGELIVAALDADVSALTIGLGDTATHDCGLGVAAALGYRFLGSDGEELEPVGRSLRRIAHIDRSGARTIPDTVSVLVYCDVLNPLCGPDGAALRFAGQKGAGIDSIEELEEGTGEFAEVIRRDLGIDVATIPGAGAAGGLGAGLAAFCGGRLTGGAEGVLDAVGFDERARNADLVITGEGRLDEKTLLGKGVAHVVRRARRVGTRVLIITGGVEGEVGWWEKELGVKIVEL